MSDGENENECYIHVPLRRRSLLGRLIRAPKVWFQHYRIVRQFQGPLDSAKAATWCMRCLFNARR